MAYVEGEVVYLYYAQCDDCGWVDEDGRLFEDEARLSARQHEKECRENLEDDYRTDREKYQDTLDVLASAVRIHNQ